MALHVCPAVDLVVLSHDKVAREETAKAYNLQLGEGKGNQLKAKIVQLIPIHTHDFVPLNEIRATDLGAEIIEKTCHAVEFHTELGSIYHLPEMIVKSASHAFLNRLKVGKDSGSTQAETFARRVLAGLTRGMGSRYFGVAALTVELIQGESVAQIVSSIKNDRYGEVDYIRGPDLQLRMGERVLRSAEKGRRTLVPVIKFQVQSIAFALPRDVAGKFSDYHPDTGKLFVQVGTESEIESSDREEEDEYTSASQKAWYEEVHQSEQVPKASNASSSLDEQQPPPKKQKKSSKPSQRKPTPRPAKRGEPWWNKSDSSSSNEEEPPPPTKPKTPRPKVRKPATPKQMKPTKPPAATPAATPAQDEPSFEDIMKKLNVDEDAVAEIKTEAWQILHYEVKLKNALTEMAKAQVTSMIDIKKIQIGSGASMDVFNAKIKHTNEMEEKDITSEADIIEYTTNRIMAEAGGQILRVPRTTPNFQELLINTYAEIMAYKLPIVQGLEDNYVYTDCYDKDLVEAVRVKIGAKEVREQHEDLNLAATIEAKKRQLEQMYAERNSGGYREAAKYSTKAKTRHSMRFD